MPTEEVIRKGIRITAKGYNGQEVWMKIPFKMVLECPTLREVPRKVAVGVGARIERPTLGVKE